MKAIDSAIQSEGLTLILLLRLCPLIPFTFFNFIVGITSLSFCDFCIGLLGIVPATIGYVFLGTTLSDIEQAIESPDWGNDKVMIIIVTLGLVLMIACLIWMTVVTKRHLAKAIEE